VAYGGACSRNVSVRMSWISFDVLEEKELMRACVSMLLKSSASPDMLPLRICRKNRLAIRHMNGPLFQTTLSISSYDVGKYVRLRNYHHHLVCTVYLCVSVCVCVRVHSRASTYWVVLESKPCGNRNFCTRPAQNNLM